MRANDRPFPRCAGLVKIAYTDDVSQTTPIAAGAAAGLGAFGHRYNKTFNDVLAPLVGDARRRSTADTAMLTADRQTHIDAIDRIRTMFERNPETAHRFPELGTEIAARTNQFVNPMTEQLRAIPAELRSVEDAAARDVGPIAMRAGLKRGLPVAAGTYLLTNLIAKLLGRGKKKG